MLHRIQIDGFKSIKSLGSDGLELRRLNVLIGPNGAGKSNMIGAFRLLDIMLKGRLQEYVGRQGGAARVLHHGPKFTQTVRMKFDFDSNGYSFELAPTNDDRLIFSEETPHFEGYSNPRKGYSFGAGHLEALLPDAPKAKPVSQHVIQAVTNWVVFHFHDTSDLAPPKRIQKVDDNRTLKADASNLAAFLYRLQTAHKPEYQRIVETVRLVAPYFDDFVLAPLATNPSDIKLEWRQRGSDNYFDGSALSDGTLRFICLTALLFQPFSLMPSLILIDEPELGLHPSALTLLAEMIRTTSKSRQILLATQSPTLLDHFEADDVIVVEQHSGASTFKRLEGASLASWLEEYALGELWLKNEIGGRP